MKSIKLFVPALLVVAFLVSTRLTPAPYESVLGERALDRIVGLSDTSTLNTQACATLAFSGQVLSSQCAGKPMNTPCFACTNDSQTKGSNPTGGPGIQSTLLYKDCSTLDQQMGNCDAGACANMLTNDVNCVNQGGIKPYLWINQ